MHGGGAERQTVSMLRHLDRTRFEPLLYLVYRSGPLLAEIPDDVPVAAFDERYTGSRRPGFLMHGRRVTDMCRFLKESEADVCYDRTFLMTLISAAAAQRAGVPNVSTIVTDPSFGFAPEAGRHQWVKKRLLRRLYNRSAAVLANSDGSARSAERFYGLLPGQVSTLHNGLDFEEVRLKAAIPIDDHWWSESSGQGNCFRIVTAGRLNWQKGFHLLIEAVRRLRDVFPKITIKLAVLGEGPSIEALNRQISDANLTASVRLMGFRLNAPAWYKTADLFVLPSFWEGMPNVLPEAMACGTAVLSTDCPSGPREILDGGQFGELCEVGSADALTDAIGKFLADEGHAQRYISRALAHVEQRFSIQNTVSKLEEILVAASKSAT